MGTPEISTLNRGAQGKKIGYLVFEMAVHSISKFYGASWDEDTKMELAQMMYDEYYWLHFAELKLFVLQAKAGEFNKKGWKKGPKDLDGKAGELEEFDGKIYGELRPNVLMKWMEQYANNSLALREVVFGDKQVGAPQDQKLLTAYVDPEVSHKLVEDFIKEFEEKRRINIREMAEEWAATDEKRKAWLNDKETQARAYALANGVDYDAVVLDMFVDRIVAGEKMSKSHDVQYYLNHKEKIEQKIKNRV